MLLSQKLSRLTSRVSSLEAEIAEHEGIGLSNLHQRRIVERCVVQLQIELELFIRNYIFDCATGLYSQSGTIVQSNLGYPFRSREHACNFLLKKNKSNREPQWAIPKSAIDAAVALGLSNTTHISAELGVAPWEVDNLRYVRNFIAHRSKESALKLRTIGLAPPKDGIDPVAIIVGVSSMGGKNYERWAGFIRGVATRLVA
jgi:hypothetical protein